MVDLGDALRALFEHYDALLFVLGVALGVLGALWIISRGPLARSLKDVTAALKQQMDTGAVLAEALNTAQQRRLADHETIIKLQDRVDTLSDTVKQVRTEYGETFERLTCEITALKAAHKAEKDRADKLEHTVRQQGAEIVALQGENRELRGQVRTLKDENKTLARTVEQQGTEIVALQGENRELTGKVSALEVENITLRGEREMLIEEVAKLKDRQDAATGNKDAEPGKASEGGDTAASERSEGR
ncbi:MAG: hypothetical protein JW910_09380 [Anaerolineae bacterium]|nr:hypothetical protein [Anaerolineae bacterium]